ncbi:type II toxin-antitoxin system HipA family toxin [Aestuariispira ectoiniformans]|uniref:type II toxin-antitoxin system HipA family toxin n=1 Tax=Aestuariispira ectoiniformans TaxID=2775080 RepID=UPI00223AFA2A|nr:type II toxin-antitoxin system HipA family toxin [Aestuariispira ectoiniformans]
MAEVLDIILHGVRVGQVVDLGGDRSVFSLDEGYISNPDRPTASLGFKTPSGGVTLKLKARQNKIDPFLSNLLPEGKLRDYVAEKDGIHPTREFQLLKALGEDLPGAVIARLNKEDSEGIPEHELAADETATRDGPLKFSLAGVQMKLSALRAASGGLTVPATGKGGNWILKFPSEKFQAVPENEFWMMTFAKRLGFDVPDFDLVPIDVIEGLPSGIRTDLGDVFAIQRFDRTEDGARIHIEDFAQVFRVYPNDKYKKGNFGMIARVLWAETDEGAIVDFVQRIVLNAAIGNGDMHLKNWSLIYPDGKTPKLAPLYDYLSTLTYVGQEDLGMNFAGTKQFHELSSDRFTTFIDQAKLPGAIAMRAAKEMAVRIRDTWADFHSEVQLPEEIIAAIESHMRLVPILNE